jgi:hypothetical protein
VAFPHHDRLPATGFLPTGYRLLATGLLIASAAACGKKGPPLAPFVRVPSAVTGVEVRRVGSDAYVTLTVPATNIDTSTPADVVRVDIYAFTGRVSPGTRFLEQATLVATIPVVPIPRDEKGRALPLPPDPQSTDAVQGGAVTIRESLTGPALQPLTLAPLTGRRAPLSQPALAGPEPPPPPVQRFYTAIASSDRRRPGPPGSIASVTLGQLPEASSMLTAEYTADLIRLRWEPSGGFFGFLLNRELPPETSPVDEPGSFTPTDSTVAPTSGAVAPTSATFASAGATLAPSSDLPPGPTRYNVYRDIAPDPLVLPTGPLRPAWRAELPRPVNAAPLDALLFEEPLVLDARERCYYVRALRGSGPAQAESDPSPAVCFTPVDTVPPAVPTELSAQAEAGAITLLWDPNIEEDLAGYVILRGAPGDATLTRLTSALVPVARYVDRSVTPGTRYVYAVKAVDNRVPLGNESAESARKEETAR